MHLSVEILRIHEERDCLSVGNGMVLSGAWCSSQLGMVIFSEGYGVPQLGNDVVLSGKWRCTWSYMALSARWEMVFCQWEIVLISMGEGDCHSEKYNINWICLA